MITMPKEKTITELYEFLQENMATKEELNSVKENMATKEELNFIKDNMVTKKEHEKTTTEIYEFLQEHMVTREEFKNAVTREEFDNLNKFLQEHMVTREEFHNLDRKVGELEIKLKDHIDEKLSDLRGDIVVLMRKEDNKVLYLIKILKDKSILEDKEVKALLGMEPFQKMNL